MNIEQFNPGLSDQDSTADMDPETLQMLEAIAQSQMLQQQEMKKKAAMQQQYPVGTDMYYEMQETQPNFDEFMRGYDPRFDPYGE